MAVLLDQIVAEHRDENAIVDSRGATTWGQLNERVERLVHALRDRGLTSGDCVMSMLGNQAEAIEVALACAHGGWLLVPVNWHWVADELAYVVKDSGSKALFVDVMHVDVAVGAGPMDGCDHRIVVGVGFRRKHVQDGDVHLELHRQRPGEGQGPQRGGG